MKLARLWYYCGWGMVVVGIVFIISGTVEDRLAFIGKGIVDIIFGIWWMRLGSRKIKEAKGTSVEEDFKELQNRIEILSCPTCDFFNQLAFEHNQSWCEAPEPPHIEKNYCYTFQTKRGRGNA